MYNMYTNKDIHYTYKQIYKVPWPLAIATIELRQSNTSPQSYRTCV